MTAADKVPANGPKKLLALDGGGIRGMITVEILAKIEEDLRTELGAGKKFVLADYFDYMSGTSTGAIIAACLSLGWPVEKLREFYLSSGAEMFDKAVLWRRHKEKYSNVNLEGLLKREFADAKKVPLTFGSDDVRTLLMMVMRNATTDSPWPISNNPRAKYNDRKLDDCNLDFPLWQLVRASTAAPVYFPPETIKVGKRSFIFVDGGITMYNNPSFQMFLMATASPYRLNWPVGTDKMLIVSIGTGTSPGENNELSPDDMNLLYNAAAIPGALMFAALNEQDLLCRAFGECRHGPVLDGEVGDMIGATGPGKKLFAYVRYNAELTRSGLDALGLKKVEPATVQKLDSVAHVDELAKVGKAVARKDVNVKEHFAGFLKG